MTPQLQYEASTPVQKPNKLNSLLQLQNDTRRRMPCHGVKQLQIDKCKQTRMQTEPTK